MESRKILEALGQVDEKYICEVAEEQAGEKTVGAGQKYSETVGMRSNRMRYGMKGQYPGKGNRKRWTPAALIGLLVCCMIFLGIMPGIVGWNRHGQTEDPSQTSIGVTIPPREIRPSKGGELADMMALFIYEGRCYVQHFHGTPGDEFVGEYVGSVDGSIDEWSSKEDWVDLAGTIRGDVYTVKGMDPEFMLCIWRPGHTSLYINDSGYTLVKGKDLYGDRLNLAGNYHKVVFLVEGGAKPEQTASFTLEGDGLAPVKDFVKGLYEGDFVWIKYVEPTRATEDERVNLHGKDRYMLNVWMENGIVWHLTLYEGGYVTFSGLHGVAVQMDRTVFDEMLAVLKAGIENAP